MGEKDAKVWRRLATLSKPSTNTERDAALLYNQYLNNGAFLLSPAESLQLSPSLIYNFYARLALFTSPGRPFYRKESCDWLTSRALYYVNVAQIGTFERLLALLPLFKNSFLVLNHFLPEDEEGKVLSHAQIAPHLLQSVVAYEAGLSCDDFAKLVIQAACRLNIGFVFTLSAQVSPMAQVIVKKPHYFEASKEGFIFDSEQEETCNYLIAIAKHWQKNYLIDGLYLNFTEAGKAISSASCHLLTQGIKTRPSFGLLASNVRSPHYFDSVLDSETAPTNINALPAPQRRLWRYLSHSFALFNHSDNFNTNDEQILFTESKLLTKGWLKRAQLVAKVEDKNFTLLAYRYKKNLSLLIFTHQNCNDTLFDLTPYHPINTMYSIDSDFFYNGSYSQNENELSNQSTLALGAMPQYSAAVYRLVFDN
jgi:hypothetical protein